MLPKVTIMIPTFNQGNILYRAIESSIMQDYPDLEIIVSDDCSTDNTFEKIKKYLVKYDNIKYFRNEQNLGRVKNYKYTLENYATGDWVVNLDGDDFFIYKYFIRESMNMILSNDNIVFLQAGHIKRDIKNINSGGVVCLPKIKSKFLILDGKEYVLNFLKFSHFSHAATIYNRKLAIETNFYNCEISSTDIDSLLRLALKGNVILYKRPVCVWLQHDYNISKNIDLSSIGNNVKWVENVYKECLIYNISEKKLIKWKKNLIRICIINDIAKVINKTNDIFSLKKVFKYVLKNYFSFFLNYYVFKLFFFKYLKLLKN